MATFSWQDYIDSRLRGNDESLRGNDERQDHMDSRLRGKDERRERRENEKGLYGLRRRPSVSGRLSSGDGKVDSRPPPSRG